MGYDFDYLFFSNCSNRIEISINEKQKEQKIEKKKKKY